MGYETEVLHPSPATEHAAASNNAYRLAQNPAGPELIRPGTSAPPAEQPSTLQTPLVPEDRFQNLLPAAGPPPPLGPVPAEQTEKEFERYIGSVIAPENTIKVIVGRAAILVTKEKPRRIYIPNEEFATCQIVTDQQIAVVGKKEGRTVLNLWFPDPNAPNDPAKDRALSYLSWCFATRRGSTRPGGKKTRGRRPRWRPTGRPSKCCKARSRRSFPTAPCNSRWWASRSSSAARPKMSSRRRRSSRIIAEHAPVSNRRRGIGGSAGGRNPNVNVNVGLGGAEAAVQNAVQSLNPGLNVSLNASPGAAGGT